MTKKSAVRMPKSTEALSPLAFAGVPEKQESFMSEPESTADAEADELDSTTPSVCPEVLPSAAVLFSAPVLPSAPVLLSATIAGDLEKCTKCGQRSGQRMRTQSTQTTEPWKAAASQPQITERENSFSSTISSVTTLNPKMVLSEAAEASALVVFQSLVSDLSAQDLLRITQDTCKVHLSRDRVGVLLEQSQGARMTCSQLKAMIELVSLDSHKKTVIYERYAQLVDKESFLEEIVQNFTRSNSLRGMVVADLSSHLECLALSKNSSKTAINQNIL